MTNTLGTRTLITPQLQVLARECYTSFCRARLRWARLSCHKHSSVYVPASVRHLDVCACVQICPDHYSYIQLCMDFKIMWQLFCITCRCTIWNIHSGRPKVKVTLEGKFFAWTITLTILDVFQFEFAELFSIMSRCAMWNICSGRSKVTRARHVVPGQPSSSG